MRISEAIFVACDSTVAGGAVINKFTCYGEKTKRKEDFYSGH